MPDCAVCVWESLTTFFATGDVVEWRRVAWACPLHTEVTVPTLEAVLGLPSQDSPLLDGAPVDGVLVEPPA